ncbi:MAG: threonine synthase [Firmicutes bacterium]|nr:threonine synthase [Bacillota bacterium]
MSWPGVLAAYAPYLPVTEKTPSLTLLEGNTPLVYASHLSESWQIRLFLKLEGLNPTGSFKDRGMVMAVAHAIEEGAQTLLCASTGNTSASAAAYAARAGLRAVVVIPEGKVALGKLAQAVLYGAEVFAIAGNFDKALALVRNQADQAGVAIVNSINPYRLEGQQTAAFEVVDALGEVPDVVALPVGNAGNITAYWKGFRAYLQAGKAQRLPRMLGFEAKGAAAIVQGTPIDDPQTVATAIRIGNPASWQGAVNAARESGGSIDAVDDDAILDAYRMLARTEGIFAEPASAAAIAGIRQALTTGQIRTGETVVAVLTGNGLKDPQTALETAQVEIQHLDVDPYHLSEALRRV